ncbi:putative nuclease HARBI1 [Prorops nasuta]|uniref:putative nuclease HARBI1 n=1 Tax=Prorops nasuta TaxID=863751 RepID=UPI0034CF2DBE
MNNIEENVIEWLFNDSYSDEDSDDVNPNLRRRSRVFRERVNYYEMLDNAGFEYRFRLSKENFDIVLQKIKNKLYHITERNEAISPTIQLQLTLRFLATGSFLIVVADFSGVSKSSAQIIVPKVLNAIAALHEDFIKLPFETNSILRTQNENFQLAGFPRTIGAIDCIHVRIQSYGGDHSEIFRNRKGSYSINVQAIVNSKLEILDVVARWPGATHDATIFDNSCIKVRFESGEFGSGVILGDSGYPCLPYLLTPLHNPKIPAEVLYNEAHIRTRSMVERCFGVLVRRFPILSMGSRFSTPERTLPMIIACVVLHNIHRLSIDVENFDQDVFGNIDREIENILHVDEKDFLIKNYFQR